LIRINPNIPYKMRGNGAAAVRIQVPESDRYDFLIVKSIVTKKFFYDLRRKGTMKVVTLLWIFMLFIPLVYAQDVPISETISIIDSGDHYRNILVFPIYAQRGDTYELEEWTISITIEPQAWIELFDGRNMKDHFSKVLVSIVIEDSRGKKTADFKSYLNCELKNCDRDVKETFLFWDHAGERRADNAGEVFDIKSPVVVEDMYCKVTVNLVAFIETWDSWPCNPSTNLCISDAACMVFLRGLTLDISIDYAPAYSDFLLLFEEASEHVGAGDQYAEAGERDKAFQEYEKAKAIYDNIGDVVRLNMVQEKIINFDQVKALEYCALAEQFFELEEYDKALTEYENAKAIYAAAGDTQNAGHVQQLIDKCRLYVTATENFNKGINTFREAESTINHEEAIKKYEEAQLWFEKAQTDFDELNNEEKSRECKTWINQCGYNLDTLRKSDENGEKRDMFMYIILVIGGAGTAAIIGLLVTQRTSSQRPEPEAFEKEQIATLKYRLATGEITTEEYEKLKSILEE
jgi:tetratricopeptide (TPR) repeat protein